MKNLKRLFFCCLAMILSVINCKAIDYNFQWSIVEEAIWYEICYGQSQGELLSALNCTNVGNDTNTALGKAYGSVYGLSAANYYYFAARACIYSECSGLSNNLLVSQGTTITYLEDKDYDGDGINDLYFVNPWTNDIWVDYAANGFNGFQEILYEDELDQIMVFVPSTTTSYKNIFYRRTSDGTTLDPIQYGSPGDIPLLVIKP